MAQVANKTCEICIRTSGSHYCMDCEQLFCEDCKTSHLRSKACRNHKFLTGLDIQPKPKVQCTKHNEEYIFYCAPCDMPVCRRCMTDSHNSHKIQELHAIVTETKSNLKFQIYSTVENLQSSLKNVKEEVKSFNKDLENTISSIHQQGEGLKNAVDKEVQELVQYLRGKSSKDLVRVSSTEHELERLLDKGGQLQKEYWDASGVKDDAFTLKTLRRITAECNNIQIPQFEKLPSVKHDKTKLLEWDIGKSLGTVSYQQQKNSSSLNSDKALQQGNLMLPARNTTVRFDVSLKPNEDTERLHLNSNYRLHVSDTCLILEDLKTQTTILKWYYDCLRRYGKTGSNFTMVSGRRSECGVGTFVFMHCDPTKITTAIDFAIKRKTKNDD